MPTTTVYPDCTVCCEGLITTPCCEVPIPQTLYALIENVDNAECLDSVTMPITYGTILPDEWVGSEDVTCEDGPTTMILRLLCGGESCDSFQLTGFCDDGAGAATAVLPDPGCSCDPVFFEFTMMDNGTPSCFSGTGQATYTVTITETPP